MMRRTVLLAAFSIACAVGSVSMAQAQCAIPYTLTNGQPADATQVMSDFDALANCIDDLPAGATNSVQFNAGSGQLGGVGPLTNGQLVVGSTGGAPQAATLTAGANVSITNGPGTVTISATGGSGPTLVQSAFKRSFVTPDSVALTTAPTAGNLLVAFANGFSGGLGVPTAFGGVYADTSGTTVNSQGIVVGARVVQPGDGTTWSGFTGGNGGDVYRSRALRG